MNIVILDGYTTDPEGRAWDALKAVGRLTVYARTGVSDTISRAQAADIVLTNKVVLGRTELAQLPRLKYIGVLATGYNVVDVAAAHAQGIVVTNVPAYSTDSVAQMVFAHLLTVVNRTEHYALANRTGQWTAAPDFCYWDTPLTELSGKHFGIVGLGHIGRRVVAIAQAFGMHVAALTSRRADQLPAGVEKQTLDELLATADVVSLHCPLTPDTRHLVNRETLARMKPSAILINTGRGPLVDDRAVADALNGRRLRAYCADVLTDEPPRADNPLLACAHAYVTPHIAWATQEARGRLLRVAIDNVMAFVSGRPVNVVSAPGGV